MIGFIICWLWIIYELNRAPELDEFNNIIKDDKKKQDK